MRACELDLVTCVKRLQLDVPILEGRAFGISYSDEKVASRDASCGFLPISSSPEQDFQVLIPPNGRYEGPTPITNLLPTSTQPEVDKVVGKFSFYSYSTRG